MLLVHCDLLLLWAWYLLAITQSEKKSSEEERTPRLLAVRRKSLLNFKLNKEQGLLMRPFVLQRPPRSLSLRSSDSLRSTRQQAFSSLLTPSSPSSRPLCVSALVSVSLSLSRSVGSLCARPQMGELTPEVSRPRIWLWRIENAGWYFFFFRFFLICVISQLFWFSSLQTFSPKFMTCWILESLGCTCEYWTHPGEVLSLSTEASESFVLFPFKGLKKSGRL